MSAVSVPQPTVEKPITVIDYIAAMSECLDFRSLTAFANACPPQIVEDDRFARAFKNQLDAIKDKWKR
jgi:hypothetical protein